ncbi:hypothetical protein F4780DRAFT_423961 [Xylariomycetidae sp. FL0641]|nr:hypothetical protein F4780DRAFT_423961 [Xylariomycetidae sp. FL0641]
MHDDRHSAAAARALMIIKPADAVASAALLAHEEEGGQGRGVKKALSTFPPSPSPPRRARFELGNPRPLPRSITRAFIYSPYLPYIHTYLQRRHSGCSADPRKGMDVPSQCRFVALAWTGQDTRNRNQARERPGGTYALLRGLRQDGRTYGISRDKRRRRRAKEGRRTGGNESVGFPSSFPPSSSPREPLFQILQAGSAANDWIGHDSCGKRGGRRCYPVAGWLAGRDQQLLTAASGRNARIARPRDFFVVVVVFGRGRTQTALDAGRAVCVDGWTGR